MAKGKYQKWIEPDALILLKGWARDGLTDEQIAKKMGISCSTLYEWKKAHSEISESLKRGKEVIDNQIEEALIKRALGYDYDESKIELYPDGSRKKTVFKRHMPADVTALIFWLKNRKRDEWGTVKDGIDKEEQKARIERLKADTEHIKKADGVETSNDDGVTLVHRGGEEYGETDDSC